MAQQGNNQHPGWENHDGKWQMPERQAEYLQWLCTPPADREPNTKAAMAERLDVHVATLRRWEKDSMFRAEWDRALAELNIKPDRVQEVIDALFKQATSGDVNAQKLYLTMVEKISPPKIVLHDKGVEDLSDDELADELEKRAIDARRGMRSVG